MRGLGLLALLLAADAPTVEVTPGTVVAFIGDQGQNAASKAVLKLIKDAGTDLVVHAGDLDYHHDPDGWDAMITAALGADFPYLVAIGNHDRVAWPGYTEKLEARLARTPEVLCEGTTGVTQACTFRGIQVLLSGVGVRNTGGKPAHESWFEAQLAPSNHRWRVCTWHKNMHAMQTGRKPDETGWGVYETCRKHGALISTGHEHAYSRTHLVTAFKDDVTADPAAPLVVRDGATVGWVSGIGGSSVRAQHNDGPHWASIWTESQEAAPGALICTFGAGGQVDRADCVFKDVKGRDLDSFTLRRSLD
jgi:3',5'-cyclic AMP phosphodiesterase CpdA